MTSSIKRARNLNRRHLRMHGSDTTDNSHDHIFASQWEELVIRFDKERGDFTVRTATGAETAELTDSAKHRLS